MTAVTFPSSPNTNDVFTAANGSAYLWDGTRWVNTGTLDQPVKRDGTEVSLSHSGDDLNIDSDTLFVDASTNRISIGHTTPLTALDISGDITVSGTVDSRDIATDGTKLDGIEAAADVTDATNVVAALTAGSNITIAADGTIAATSGTPSAAEILTAITSVDGSGSGLDADTLDGIQGANFLRSDADDTMVGKLQITPSGFVSGIQNLGCINISSAGSGETRAIDIDGSWATNESKSISFIHGSSASDFIGQINCLWNGSATEFRFGKFYHGANSTGYPMIMRSTSTTTADLLVNGSTVWHAGNDGAGSGLDADLWDGNQFASYLNQAVLTTSGPTFADIYNTGWFRNQSAGQGLYNTATGHHFYSASAAYWHLNSTNGLIIYSAYNASAGNATSRKGYLYHDTNGFGLLGQAGSWAVNIRTTGTDVIFGGHVNNNSYNSVSSARVSFGGGNDMNNYSLGTTQENVGGTYTKLDIRWHTGIRIGAQTSYGGVRIFTNEDFGTLAWQFSGSSNYTYKHVWLNTTTAGIFSATHGAHLHPKTSPSHGSWEITGASGGYGGLCVNYTYYNNLMYDSGGNGGLYQQNGAGWHFYYHRTNTCLGINGSTTSSSYGAYVTGNFYATGNITAYSDRRKKANIKTIESGLFKVLRLRGVSYNKIGIDDSISDKTEIGVIAQEINEVVPEVVTYAEDVDEYGVSYGNLAALLIEAIKEQATQIKLLQFDISKLKSNQI